MQEYFLQNVGCGYAGDALIFWRDGGGYSPNIDEAKKFTENEADSMIRATKGSHNFRKWKIEDIQKASHRVVDLHDLPKENEN